MNSTNAWTSDSGYRMEATDGPPCPDLIRLLGDGPTGAGWQVTHKRCTCRCDHEHDSCTVDFLDPPTGIAIHYSNGRWGRTANHGLDDYIHQGTGDPRALLAGARPFWRTEEVLAAVQWMRGYNRRHPDDPVRFAAVPPPPPPGAARPAGQAGIELALAEQVIQWYERTADRIVYWGGLAHTVKGSDCVPPVLHTGGLLTGTAAARPAAAAAPGGGRRVSTPGNSRPPAPRHSTAPPGQSGTRAAICGSGSAPTMSRSG
ncbi:erythromycin esterase family protein [Streptomyces sp. NPDC020965]|uniref:erythromycin esterase family protein n=1 Tax=Streptomyces sp. NPDC020965 TaxID=3365105 RepID=UPI0037BCA2BF